MSHRRNPQSLLTPAMRDVLHAIAKAGRPPMALLTAEQAKQAFALGAGVLEVNAQKMARDDTRSEEQRLNSSHSRASRMPSSA